MVSLSTVNWKCIFLGALKVLCETGTLYLPVSYLRKQLLDLPISFLFFFWKRFIYLKNELYIERDTGLPSADLFLKGLQWQELGQAKTREPGGSCKSPTWKQGPSTWATFDFFPRCISRGLNWKWATKTWMGCWCHKWQLNLICNNPGPRFVNIREVVNIWQPGMTQQKPQASPHFMGISSNCHLPDSEQTFSSLIILTWNLK